MVNAYGSISIQGYPPSSNTIPIHSISVNAYGNSILYPQARGVPNQHPPPLAGVETHPHKKHIIQLKL